MASKFSVNRHVKQNYSVLSRVVSDNAPVVVAKSIKNVSDINYTITFHVKDFDGKAITDATVVCNNYNVINYFNGTYVVVDIPNGEYGYSISKNGFVPVNGSEKIEGYDLEIEVFLCELPSKISNNDIKTIMGEEVYEQMKFVGSSSGSRWSIIEGRLPSNLTLNENGLISGNTIEFGKFDFTVKVENACDEISKKMSVYVCAKPEITTGDLNFLEPSVSEQLQFVGSRPGTWSIVEGELPNGLILNGKSGILSGNATEFGRFYVTLKVVNSCGEQEKEIEIFVCGKPKITSNDDTKFVMDEAGSVQLTATGTQGIWSVVEGNLPNGLSLDENSGIISGTPTVFGFFKCTIKLSNQCGEDKQIFKIFVCGKPQKIKLVKSDCSNNEEPYFVSDEPVSGHLCFLGTRPGTWSISEGALPDGLTLDPQNGIISGITEYYGDLDITFRVDNPCGFVEESFVIPICGKPKITGDCIHGFVIGEYGSEGIVYSGSEGVWSIEGGDFPEGLSLDPETGIISGTPLYAGSFTFMVKLTNDCGEANKNIKLSVCAPPVIQNNTIDFLYGEEMSQKLAFSGSRPGKWTIIDGELPVGLILNSDKGTISGTATTPGDFYFTLRVENPCGIDEKEVNLFVCAKPIITCESNLNFVKDEYGTVEMTYSGSEGVWSIDVGELIEGLELDPNTGVISGIPPVSGTFFFTAKIENSCGEAYKDMRLIICGKPQITTNEIDSVLGEPVSKKLQFSGSRPGTWSVIGLPAGLSLNNDTIVGTPTEFGDFVITAKVENHCGEDEKEITMSVCAKPYISSGWVISFPLNEEHFYELSHDGTPGKWSISDGYLPDGLDLTEYGVIIGTALESGHFVFTLKVVNDCGEAEREVDMFVCELPVIKVDNMSLLQNVPIEKQLIFSGSRSGKWSVSNGSLPLGVSLSKNGVFSGTPTQVGEFNITLTVTNPCGTDNKDITIKVERTYNVVFSVQDKSLTPITDAVVKSGAFVIVNNGDGTYKTKLTQGVHNFTVENDGYFTYNSTVEVKWTDVNVTVTLCLLPQILEEDIEYIMGEPVSYQLEFIGDMPAGWSIVDGGLPAGLTMNGNGLISGTATEFGDFTFTARVDNECGFDEKEMIVSICAEPEITNDANISFVFGETSSIPLTYSGTEGMWEIVSGTLPAGLSFDEESGIISGTPTVSGNFSILVRFTNICGVANKLINIFVCVLPKITSQGNLNFIINEYDSEQLTFDGSNGVWSIVNGGLPNGLELTESGEVVGTPTESGNFVLTVKVTNQCGDVTQKINVFVCALPNITSSAIEFVKNVPMSEQLKFSGSRPGTWSIVSGSLPNGITLNKNGVVSGTTSQVGAFSVTVKVENPCGEDEREINMFTCAKPIITKANISFVKNEYSVEQLECLGTFGTWSIIDGELPDGLELNPESGEVFGTPTVSGTFNFTVRIVNGCGEAEKVIAVHICAKPMITTDKISYSIGSPVNIELGFAGNRPGAWSVVSGSLPTGLMFNTATGVISGNPTEFGDFNVTFKVVNPCGEDEKEITIGGCAPPTILCCCDMDFVMGESGSTQLVNGGTPGTWSVVSGSLPAGLTLDPNTGIISGTPTVSGTFSFSLKVENDCGEDTQTIKISICAKPTITSANTMEFVLDVENSFKLTFTGSRPGTWSIISGKLPLGVTLDEENGIISGIAKEAGDFTLTIQVENPCGVDAQLVNLFVCTKPVITSGWSMEFPLNEYGSYQLTHDSSGGTWSIVSGLLPSGLSLNGSTGLISGTATIAGRFKILVKIANSCSETIKEMDIFVCGFASITTTHLDFAIGTPGTGQLLFSGSTPGTWSIVSGTLPTGLTLNSATGVISGTPTVGGSSVVRMKVENDCGEDEKNVTINVSSCVPPTALIGDMTFFLNEYESKTLNHSGSSPVVWSVTSGVLPSWLILNPTAATISGTPTVLTNFVVTLRVTNECGYNEKTITITVSENCIEPKITLPETEDGIDMIFIMGEYDSAQLTASGTPGTWSIDDEDKLPDGLTFSETGVIDGIPTESGTFIFNVKIENDCGEDEEEINLFVCEIAEIEIPDPEDLTFETGEEVFIQLNASGTPGSWSVSPLSQDFLPVGLDLNSETGVISGKTNEFGLFNILFQFNSPCCEITQELTIFIESEDVCVEPKITTVEPLYFVVGEEDSKQIDFTGTAPQI